MTRYLNYTKYETESWKQERITKCHGKIICIVKGQTCKHKRRENPMKKSYTEKQNRQAELMKIIHDLFDIHAT